MITIEDIARFCKMKGFVYPSSDIYGGLAGFWDFGPLGVELLNNIKKEWWSYFVHQKENMVGLDASIISNPKVWKASGHVANFSDVAVACKKCKKANKVDKTELEKAKCSFCGGELDKTSAKNLQQMLTTKIGPVEQDSTAAYLRPENAQGMFTNFKLVTDTSRIKLPFGIAQIGKCFRNEIAPRDFLFRSREFTIAEFEFFIHPEETKCSLLEKSHLDLKLRLLNAENQVKGKNDIEETTIGKMVKEKRLNEWHAYWLAEQIMFFKSIGIDTKKIKIREHMKDELSHYSSATFDLDYDYPFGSKEIAGNANRGQFDLTNHTKESGEKLDYFDDATKTRVIPKVIEPTFGIDRIFLATIVDAYNLDEKRGNIVLKLHPKLVPIQLGVFSLINKLNDEAKEVFDELKKEFTCFLDLSGSVGRRYARADEIGIPYCLTVDFDCKKNKDVTIRDRDSTKQIRIKRKDLKDTLRRLLNQEINFEEAGKLIK